MLSDDEILDIATAAGLRFSMYSDDVETRAAIKRLARAVEQAAYAAAIKACESLENRVISTHPARIEFDPNSLMARKCVGAIRLLMQENTDAAR